MRNGLRIFIGYARKDEALKKTLLDYLARVRRAGLSLTWDAHAVDQGRETLPAIYEAVEGCQMALLLLSADFLAADFMRSMQLARLLDRRAQENLRVVPVLLRPCHWQQGELGELPALPEDAKALSSYPEASGEHDAAWQAVAQRLAEWIGGLTPGARTPPPARQVDLRGLPPHAVPLVGRRPLLSLMDRAYYTQDISVLGIIGEGGVGKSALVTEWLACMAPSYGGAGKVFGWSFHSQGNPDLKTSSGPFFERALRFFGHSGEPPRNDDAKARRLLELLRAQPAILVLDGVQPLQHRPHLRHGECADMGLKALLHEVRGRGLGPRHVIVVTSRQPLVELGGIAGYGYQVMELEPLNPGEGANLLGQLKVQGSLWELTTLSKAYGGHPLALVLLGRLLGARYQGRAEAAAALPPLAEEEKPGGRARRVLRFYDAGLWPAAAPERRILSMLALVNRSLLPDEQALLIKEADFARPLGEMSADALAQTVEELRQAGLLSPVRGPLDAEWDTHPMIRAYFAAQFMQGQARDWQQAHRVLFAYFQRGAPQAQPDTLAGLEPLYRAVRHGCLGGEARQALAAVMRQRIHRGEAAYSLTCLGAYAQDLEATACFFPQDWQHPPVAPGLDDAEQAWLLQNASRCLFALGRLEEAGGPLWAALRLYEKNRHWPQAARAAGLLVELLVPLGQLEEARRIAQQGGDWAQAAGDPALHGLLQARLGRVLHYLGELAAAQDAFRAAAATAGGLALSEEPHDCLLLLDAARDDHALERAWSRSQSLSERAALHGEGLAKGMAQLVLGQVLLATRGSLEAQGAFGAALAEMRRSDQDTSVYLPKALLAYAGFRRRLRQLDVAQQALDEALDIVQRCGMRLYEADAYLLQAHLLLDKAFQRPVGMDGILPPRVGLMGAGSGLEEAENLRQQIAGLLEDTRYGLRQPELALLAARLAHYAKRPLEARAHLEAARQQIERLGYWNLAAAWEQVGAELG